MHIGPTTDQINLRDNVREILAAVCPLTLTRRAYTDSLSWQHFWKQAVGLGWTSLARRGFENNLELGTLDLILTLESFGAVLAPIPFLSSVGLAAGAARAGGAAMNTVLSEIDSGSVATLAAQPTYRRFAGAPMRFRDKRIQGTALAVPDAVHADLIVLLCTTGRGVAVAAVRLGDGVTVSPVDSADPSRPLATVTLDAAPVSIAPVSIRAAIGPATLAVAAELLGVAQGALDLAVEHARNRRQFDRPIGANQAVKHALADCHVAVERARSLTYLAAARLDSAAPVPDQVWGSCLLAKAAAGDAALSCARTAVQVFGALGQTWEHDIHLYLRRAWVGAAQFGDSSSLYAQVGQRFLNGAPQ
ncbi:MAG: acyl-CoA dehydrogenase family protein [Mycobacterium sp.]